MRTILENLVLVPENTILTTNGNKAIVSTADKISVQITTNSTDYKVEFEVSLTGKDSDWSLISGYSTEQQAIWSTSCEVAHNTLWSFDIDGVEFFRTRISKINNGNIKILATSYHL